MEGRWRTDAATVCNSELLPAFTRYREAGEKVFDFNMQQGTTRGRNILDACAVTQVALAGFAVIIFILGSLFGLFR